MIEAIHVIAWSLVVVATVYVSASATTGDLPGHMTASLAMSGGGGIIGMASPWVHGSGDKWWSAMIEAMEPNPKTAIAGMIVAVLVFSLLPYVRRRPCPPAGIAGAHCGDHGLQDRHLRPRQ